MSDPWADTANAQPHLPRPQAPPPPRPSHDDSAPTQYGAAAQDYGAAPTQYGAPAQQGYGAPPSQGYGAPPSQGYGAPSSQGYGPSATPPSTPPPAKGSWFKRLFRDPLSIVLVIVIVLAVALAGLVGVELYARHLGEQKVAEAVSCVVQDDTTVSFGATPFLWQYFTDHFSDITVTTGGNQIRSLKGMKAQIHIDDIKLEDTADSKGTIGALDATLTWTTQGLNDTIKDEIPLVGGFIDVTAKPDDGTFELDAPLGGAVSVKPEVVDGEIKLEVTELSGLGLTLPKETVQPALDKVTKDLSDNYPLGIKADSIQVTNDGVVAHFSTKNASIPKDASSGSSDGCMGTI